MGRDQGVRNERADRHPDHNRFSDGSAYGHGNVYSYTDTDIDAYTYTYAYAVIAKVRTNDLTGDENSIPGQSLQKNI